MSKLAPLTDHDYTGALEAIAYLTDIVKGQTVTLSRINDDLRLRAWAAVPDNVDTGRPIYVAKHDVPVGETGIFLPWMVWYDAYVHWFDDQIGLDSQITDGTPAAGALTVESSDVGDTTQTITVYGTYLNDTGTPRAVTVTLDGTNPVTVTATGLFGGGVLYGAKLSAACAGTVAVKDGGAATCISFTAGTTTRGLVAYNYDNPNEDVLTVVADGASTKKLIAIDDADGLELLTLDGTTEVLGTTVRDNLAYIAYGNVAAATTVTVTGTRDLQSGPLYLDPDETGWYTQQSTKLGTGSRVPVGFYLDATTAFLNPTPAHWFGGDEVLSDDIDAVEAIVPPSVVPVIAVANATGGSTDAALTLDLYEVDGVTPISAARTVLIICNATQYTPVFAAPGVTFGTATKGSIVDSGDGWCLATTSAAGEFDCTATNAADNTRYFYVKTAESLDNAANACLVLPGVADTAAWSA